MNPSVKYAVIYRHRTEYPVIVMCNFFAVPRSGYYSFVSCLGTPVKDAELIEKISQQQRKCFETYGYRRIWQWLKNNEGIYRHKPATFSEANEMIERYFHFYNHERIQLKTGEPPLTQRLSS